MSLEKQIKKSISCCDCKCYGKLNIEERVICFCGEEINLKFFGEHTVESLFLLD